MRIKTMLLPAQLFVAITALGCTAAPDLAPSNRGESGLEIQQSAPRLSPESGRPSSRIVGPNQQIRIRSADNTRYVCSNGSPLMCDQVGTTAYCTCAGIW